MKARTSHFYFRLIESIFLLFESESLILPAERQLVQSVCVFIRLARKQTEMPCFVLLSSDAKLVKLFFQSQKLKNGQFNVAKLKTTKVSWCHHV